MMRHVRRSSWALGLFLGLSLAGGCSSDSPVGPIDETDDSSATDDTSGVDETTDSGLEPACGNGIVEPGEACDEGGPTATCNDDCTPATCGDGVANAEAGEECDDGGSSATCDWDCTLAVCGDGLFNALAGEACDDAGASGACEADCTLIECGDGTTNAAVGEDCDDAGESETCNSNCTVAQCGDGIANVTAGETCDDAGPSARCDEDCTAAQCGDGLSNVPAGELCDVGDLGGATCAELGFGLGTLACADGCQSYETSSCAPAEPVLSLSFSPVKRFDFSWATVQGAEHYQVLESAVPGEPYVPLGGGVMGESVSFEVPLHLRWQASYVLQACNAAGCTESDPVYVVGSLAEVVGYANASNSEMNDVFGLVALSGDGSTLAVGAPYEDSNATGVGGNQADNSMPNSGAVYVFTRDGLGAWSQQAYIKASNTGWDDFFGVSVALSEDGSTLAVGAYGEDSNATGVGGNQANNTASSSGAVYVFTRDGLGAWSQQAYVKASNTGWGDFFGVSVALSGDGSTLAVGAYGEDSNATGVGGNQADDSMPDSGAVYVFTRDGLGAWSQQAYVKASNTGGQDLFGWSVALSGDGSTLAVGAYGEDSNAMGIGGNQADNSMPDSGAVYVFTRDGLGAWSQQVYLKASNTGTYDYFGDGVALSGDGSTLAVGAYQEDSNATGIDGNQANNSAPLSGAMYVFTRDGLGAWSQQAYVKASNTDASDRFGRAVALSGDGSTLAVGASGEDSNATGIGGHQADDSEPDSGAVYVFTRDGLGAWSQHAYVKASNTAASFQFGSSVALSGDGSTLAVGALFESTSVWDSGAVYLY